MGQRVTGQVKMRIKKYRQEKPGQGDPNKTWVDFIWKMGESTYQERKNICQSRGNKQAESRDNPPISLPYISVPTRHVVG